MRTIIHEYHFDTSKPEDKGAYLALKEKLHGMGLKCFETWGGGSHYRKELDGLTIELEDKFLFSDQWNTAPIEGISDKGLRVHDWAQDACVGDFPEWLKRGHWLEQTGEMTAARASRVACGYTGKQIDAAGAPLFNLDALDSEYLTEKDLHLIRYRPIVEKWSKSAPELTADERAYLMPLFIEAQTHARTERGKARLAKLRQEIDQKRDSAIAKANAEWAGFDFCIRRGINTGNLIYYGHTGKFSFGWRKPLSLHEEMALREAIAGFPADFEIVLQKTA